MKWLKNLKLKKEINLSFFVVIIYNIYERIKEVKMNILEVKEISKKFEEIYEFLTPKFKKKFDFVIKFFVRNSEKWILI